MSTTTPLPSRSPPRRQLWRPRTKWQVFREALIEKSLLACGLLSIVITVAIAYVVIKGTADFFADPKVSFRFFATGLERLPLPASPEDREQLARKHLIVAEGNETVTIWNPEWTAGFDDPRFCILPLLAGTITVAVVAALVSLPVGLATAIYLSEYATPRVRAFAKPTLEILAGIPTVVYGFFALATVTPLLHAYVLPSLETPYNQLSGGIVVGVMIIPLVASMSEDALRSVPRSLRDGSYALGATKFETSIRVVVPAALSGILASFVLAISRAVGETMAVSLACGDRPKLSFNPLEGVATMTAFIVRIAKGDVQHGSTDFNSLFAVACTLFFMTLLMNVFSQWIMRRYRQVYQ